MTPELGHAIAVLAGDEQDAIGDRTTNSVHLGEYFLGCLAAFQHAREGTSDGTRSVLTTALASEQAANMTRSSCARR
ncbi:hypothetical protein ABZ312_41025 [Streptomyces sp. NPDC006207]